MLVRLERAQEIASAQRQLETTIRARFTERVVRNIGFPGDTYHGAIVHTDGTHWHNTHDDKASPNTRRLNWFGRMVSGGALDISVEVNTSYKGHGRRVAGCFARDNTSGNVYLMHSGRVGGGRKGVGKFEFLRWSEERLLNVRDSSGRSTRAVLVMNVRGPNAAGSEIRYVEKVEQFKRDVRAGKLNAMAFRRQVQRYRDFYSESSGQRRGTRAANIDYISRHGDIVDALEAWRKLRPNPTGARIVKNVLVDMGMERDDDLLEVYEVKTSTKRSSLYAAIGQVMVHGKKATCKRVIVLPMGEELQDDVTGALQRLGIGVIQFKLDNKSAKIFDTR